MRDWHHKIIELTDAWTLIGAAPRPMVMGIMENGVEYKAISEDALGYKYEAANDSLSGTLMGKKKTFFTVLAAPVRSKVDFNQIPVSIHATAVAGIIGASTLNNLPTKGLIENCFISNFNSSIFNVLVNTGILSEIYLQNNEALKVNKSFNPGKYTFDTLNQNTPPSMMAEVINMSFTPSMALWDGTKEVGEKETRKAIRTIFDTVKAYSRNGRGTILIAGAGNSDKNASKDQALSNYDYPLIVAASCISDNKIESQITEQRALYSSYGERVDLCAPSNGRFDQNNAQRNGIYTTAFIGGGELGGGSDTILTKTIVDQSDNSGLTLILNDIDGLFEGNCVEIGSPGTVNHEILVIESIDPTLKKIKFAKPRYYTAHPFSINPATVTIPVLSTSAKVEVTLRNKISDLGSIKGFGYVGQQIYIYNNTLKHKAIITKVNINKSYEFNPAIPSAANITDVQVIPGQVVIKLAFPDPSSGTDTKFDISSQHTSAQATDLLKSLFVGELTNVYRDGVLEYEHIAIDSINVNLKKLVLYKTQINTVGNSGYLELRTIGYGSYTSTFGGTSAATPVVSGVAGLLLQANTNINVLEMKHILKATTDHIGGSYTIESDIDMKNYGYSYNNKLGTGRVNAKKAVQLAIDWHSSSPSQTVVKPELQIADKLSDGYSGAIVMVNSNEPVDSPDIWIKKLDDNNQEEPSVSTPFNTISTEKDQKIFVRVRNTGNRKSFAENDVRVFVAFSDDPLSAFKFPDKWYDQELVKLIDVKQIGYIEAGLTKTVTIEWKRIKDNWDTWNPADSNGKRKKTYILAHIAPFDGLDTQVQLDNIRNNKQLTCKEITVTHAGIKYSGVVIPGTTYDIPVETAVVQKQFDLDISNIAATELAGVSLKFTRKNRLDGAEQSIIYAKDSEGIWSITDGQVHDWISFTTPTETEGSTAGYKNIIFPHILAINEDEENIRLEILNA